MSGKAELGFFSFTEVTDPLEHQAYNEWHQLDHLPEQYQLPGIVLGQRWVCSPPCRRARAFVSELLDPVQYVTLYLMSAPVEATLESFGALGQALREAGRFHMKRRACLSGPFDVLDSLTAPRVPVSSAVLPFRPNLGVYLIVESRDAKSDVPSSPVAAGLRPDHLPTDCSPRDEAAHSWSKDTRIAVELASGPGVAGVWRFVTKDSSDDLGSHTVTRRVTVCYLDAPPLAVSNDLALLVREIWADRPVPEYAGPFETIVPWRWDWFDEHR